jgi:hypothetical protein
MSLCKKIFFSILLIGFLQATASAQTNSPASTAAPATSAPAPRKFTFINYLTFTLSYLSWGEKVQLTRAAQTDQAHCNMLGNSLGVEWEHYYELRYGYILQGAALFGVADVGGTQSSLAFNQINQHWWGAESSVRFAYRFSKWTITSIGPIVIYRGLKLTDDPSGTSAQSGATVNAGATADLRMRLNDSLELREEIGALAVNASTYWSVGLGYKF